MIKKGVDRGGRRANTSVPREAYAKPRSEATPLPLEEPEGSWFGTWAAITCPPHALQPLEELVERKLAHCERLVLPRMIMPALRRLAAIVESDVGLAFRRA